MRCCGVDSGEHRGRAHSVDDNEPVDRMRHLQREHSHVALYLYNVWTIGRLRAQTRRRLPLTLRTRPPWWLMAGISVEVIYMRPHRAAQVPRVGPHRPPSFPCESTENRGTSRGFIALKKRLIHRCSAHRHRGAQRPQAPCVICEGQQSHSGEPPTLNEKEKWPKLKYLISK